jgi:folate-binding protein YgfZ
VTLIDDQVAALESGSAFVDLSAWRVVRVGGRDAGPWLNDLLSADLAGLEPGSARRSLLLTPRGHVRAEVTVAPLDGEILIFQDPIQDDPIDGALAPYILSSDVALEDVTDRIALLAFPGSGPPEDVPGRPITPSVLGSGTDLVAEPAAVDEVRIAARGAGSSEAGPEAVETWRIRRGVLRVGVDLGPDSLPNEGEVDRLIGHHKGCFLGQEAVAKVRNLGHPPFVLLSATAGTQLSAGDPVRSGDADAGQVTSATPAEDGASAAIIRVRWKVREDELRAADGTPLRIRGPATAA